MGRSAVFGALLAAFSGELWGAVAATSPSPQQSKVQETELVIGAKTGWEVLSKKQYLTADEGAYFRPGYRMKEAAATASSDLGRRTCPILSGSYLREVLESATGLLSRGR
jgi:hypothetical protein